MVKVSNSKKNDKSKKSKNAKEKSVAKKRDAKASKNRRGSVIEKIKKAKIKESVMFDLPHYPQTEEFTSSAASAMMVLKYINPDFKLRREHEYDIWQEAVNGSVWHGSRYGLAYALAKRGAKVGIISNMRDEGYERKLAVDENINLDTLAASFNEIREKARSMNIDEEFAPVSLNMIKKALSAKHIPIVLIDGKIINPYLESSPHWVVVKGYDKDGFYINDPYSDSTITIDPEVFKQAIGYDNNHTMIVVDTKNFDKSKLGKE
ncbi:MAG: peptidase C39 family protein [Candidatus Micrarchaeota archaeon]